MIPRPSAVRAALVVLVLACGCSKNASRVAGPRGDNGGDHLLTFRSDRGGTTGQYDLYLYDLDAGGYRSLGVLNSGYDESEPCVSNDGNYVTFASNRPGGLGGYDVYLYDRLQDALIPLPNLNSAANETNPRFTYDSVHLAFVTDVSGNQRVRLYEPLGDSLIALPNLAASGPYDDTAPAPDLSGNRIAFQSNRTGRRHVYVWDRAMNGLLSLPGIVSDSEEVEPALTSDGRWLSFASSRAGGAGGWDVYEYDLAADTLVSLPNANTAGDERHPTLSADGQILFFQARTSPAAKYDIWEYSRATSALSQPTGLPSVAGDDTQPYVRWR